MRKGNTAVPGVVSNICDIAYWAYRHIIHWTRNEAKSLLPRSCIIRNVLMQRPTHGEVGVQSVTGVIPLVGVFKVTSDCSDHFWPLGR